MEYLLERNLPVSVFDISQKHEDVPYYVGKICDKEQVADALQKVCFNFIAVIS